MDDPSATSGDLKDSGDGVEFLPVAKGIDGIDAVIVQLHTTGETYFQAFARAAAYPGADTSHPDLAYEISRGRIPLRSGHTVELPPLRAAGVATICRFEIESAEYDALNLVTTRPSREPEPRMATGELLPVLREAGLSTRLGPPPPTIRRTTHASVADATGINRRTIDRICSGEQKTVRLIDAIEILMHLGHDERARTLEYRLNSWYENRRADEIDEVEYLQSLGTFARMARVQRGLSSAERQALDDAAWLSAHAQQETFIGTTARDRLDYVMREFEKVHQRTPTELSPRLQRQAQTSMKAQAERDERHAASLRKGLHHGGEALSESAVYVRTHRLRRAGLLPDNSRPITFRPDPSD